MFQALHFPTFDIKIKEVAHKAYVYDVVRKKFVFLSPEEWVRQHVIHYLIGSMHYPKQLFKIEGGNLYNTRKKRSDIVVYNRAGAPFLLVECKSVLVAINDKVFFQAITYNHHFQAPYVCMTNGLQTYIYKMPTEADNGGFLNDFPKYDSI